MDAHVGISIVGGDPRGAVFAVAHLHYGVGIAIIFIYALVLGWARLRTGNLRACIVLHMLLNAAATVVPLLRQ